MEKANGNEKNVCVNAEEKNVKLVYVASKLNDPNPETIEQNRVMAERYAAAVSSIRGLKGLAPHAFLPKYLDDHSPNERKMGLAMGIAMLEHCDALIAIGTPSAGMMAEIKRAEELGLHIMRLPHIQDPEQVTDTVDTFVVCGWPGDGLRKVSVESIVTDSEGIHSAVFLKEDSGGMPTDGNTNKNILPDDWRTPILSNKYWDCECETHYIQSNDIDVCTLCGAEKDYMPDSHQREVDAGVHFAKGTPNNGGQPPKETIKS